MALEDKDIRVGGLYRGKRPKYNNFIGDYDDRIVVWRGVNSVQYDSITVKIGMTLPTVTMDKFLKWASHEVVKPTGGEA